MKAIARAELEWDLGETDWQQRLARCPGATFFHSEAWLKSVQLAFHTRIERVQVHLGGDRWALLPLSIRPLARGLVPLAVAGETGAYGGLLSPERLTQAEVAAAYAAVRERYRNLVVVGNPLAAGPHIPADSHEIHETHLLRLAPLAQLRRGFSRGCKSRCNKARRQGFALRIASDLPSADDFYPLYLDSARRWGRLLTWIRPRAYFTGLLEAGAPDVRFFFATQDDRPVSAILVAAYGNAVHYLAGATRSDALEASPSNFLLEEALAHYAAAGYEFFDFGPSHGLAGVVQFKASFGALPVPFLTRHYRSVAERLYFLARVPYDRARALAEL